MSDNLHNSDEVNNANGSEDVKPKPVLTRLRFKNWRSLRDVTIDDLQPINVFIGANSSGKTNIIDALYFLRDSVVGDPFNELARRGWEEDVFTAGVNKSEDMELGIAFRLDDSMNLEYDLAEKNKVVDPKYPDPTYWFEEKLRDNAGNLWLEANNGPFDSHATALDAKGVTTRNAPNPNLGLLTFGRMSAYPQIRQTFQFITERWQMLDEGFSPRLSVPSGTSTDLFQIGSCAENLPSILEFMQSKHPKLYAQLQEVMSWLLTHVSEVNLVQESRETRIAIGERAFKNQEAPTISAGTARILAMFTAYYALDMRYAELPGLVVIEEPDTALNPSLLRNFVEQLRNYVEGEHPRQFILTTHNPQFLNYFRPEEVRVVSRDENGYTTVERVPEHIREIWLDEYGLGEVWTTNSFGGLGE